jgi:hypothetical protein
MSVLLVQKKKPRERGFRRASLGLGGLGSSALSKALTLVTVLSSFGECPNSDSTIGQGRGVDQLGALRHRAAKSPGRGACRRSGE